MSNTVSDVDELPVDSSDYPTESEGYTIYTGFGEEGEDYEEIFEGPEVWRTEDFISGHYMSEECDIEENILEFDHSYGYDCKKLYNLIAADKNTIIFLSGNLIHFYDITTKELWFRRSSTGGGLGHATKNPNHTEFSHIAIGENGIQPPIIIYEWPSLEIISVLKNGTSRIYTDLNYSPDGNLLASQGGEEDFLITVWTWKSNCILLRCKSYVNDVFRVMFSPSVPGHLTTCGVGHIKFWKMANTFTGLKLQGQVGRFGKTEYTDVIGIYPMPDEKVISGCSWGNILIWDEGLIKIEVFRKGRKKCHDAAIVQFAFKDGELWSVAMDGRVRAWYYDTIDLADPPDDDRVVTLEPTYDFETPGAMYMCIKKQDEESPDHFYFAQDGNGGIWLIDLETEDDPKPSERLLVCHAGNVRDMEACPFDHYLVTLGFDGRLMIFKYMTRDLIFVHQFPANGCCLIWVPIDVDSSGDVLITAFDDGTLRVIVLIIDEKNGVMPIKILQTLKPHNKPVTAMSLNRTGEVLVTGGEDPTIFIFQVQSSTTDYIKLVPIGYVKIPDATTCLTWHRTLDFQLIVGCIHGQIAILDVVKEVQPYTTITYILDIPVRTQKFTTYKAQIRRDIVIAKIEARKMIKRLKKEVELAKIKKDNPGLEIDEEVFLADSESEEVLEPLHIPEVPNKILWIQHTDDDTLWLSMGGYDAGYIYEYQIGQKSEIPYKFLLIPDTDDTEISSYVYNSTKEYFIVALEHGEIRVYRRNPDNFHDLNNYWQLSMHDNQNGFVPKMCFSFDESFMFSCGYDGNVFSYKFNAESYDISQQNIIESRKTKEKSSTQTAIEDKDEYASLSLEEEIVKAEVDRILKVANANKAAVVKRLEELRMEYVALLTRNKAMATSQIIPIEDLEIDSRITQNLDDKLSDDLKLVERKLSFSLEKSKLAMAKMRRVFVDNMDCFHFKVYTICGNVYALTFHHRRIDDFDVLLEEVDRKILAAELKGRPPERPPVAVAKIPTPEKKEKKLEYFLLGLSPSTIQSKLPEKLNRLLRKYRFRKANWEKRQYEWDLFNALKPPPNVTDVDDVALLAQAQETIGDFKLKSAQNYKVPKHLRESTLKKYKELLLVKRKDQGHCCKKQELKTQK